MKLPNKKITNYVEQQSGSELLIYNLSTDQAFCLNETAATVFAACDGATSFTELEKRSNFSNELISLTLDELKKRDFIQDDYTSAFAGMSRREVIRKVGFASMIVLPVISGLIAPSAAQAASACVGNENAVSAPGNGIAASCSACATALNARCCSGLASIDNCSFNSPCNGVCRFNCLQANESVSTPGLVASCSACATALRAQCCSGLVIIDNCGINSPCNGVCR